MRRFFPAALLALILIFTSVPATAQVFNGPGLKGGVTVANQIEGPIHNEDARAVTMKIVISALNFLSLAAVIVIIIAGIWLIVSLGNEEAMNKAKKIILYTIVGLLIVLFARIIVLFFTVELPPLVTP